MNLNENKVNDYNLLINMNKYFWGQEDVIKITTKKKNP